MSNIFKRAFFSIFTDKLSNSLNAYNIVAKQNKFQFIKYNIKHLIAICCNYAYFLLKSRLYFIL